jgi:hypothetical protein
VSITVQNAIEVLVGSGGRILYMGILLTSQYVPSGILNM